MGVGGLERLRGVIDGIDSAILSLVRARMEVCREIGRVKSIEGAPIVDEARESQVLARASDSLEYSILELLVTGCRRVQETVAGGGGGG